MKNWDKAHSLMGYHDVTIKSGLEICPERPEKLKNNLSEKCLAPHDHQSFGVYITGGQKIKVLGILPNLVVAFTYG